MRQNTGRGGSRGTDVAPNEMVKHLRGIDFPVRKQQLMEHAEEEGAPEDVLDMIQRLPDREYDGMDDVMRGYGEIK